MKFIASSFLTTQTSAEIGGKAAQLWELAKLGLAVPKWGVIPVNDAETVPDSLLREISFFFGPNARLAVRSSAPDEDGSTASFAGQFESILNVSGQEVKKAITQVLDSRHAARVQAYRLENDQASERGMAVIIQEMVSSEVSGVAFGVDPVSGDRNAVVVNAVYGLGEGLVSGELNADQFTWRHDQWITELADKVHAVTSTENGVESVALDAALVKKASLSIDQLDEIKAALQQIQSAKGKPQDVEFAYAKGKLWILQARPVTGLDKLKDSTARMILWDNSNIIESYPGLTSPLTFSFITRMYAGVYLQLSALFGVKESVLADNHHTFTQMLGLLNGRVYYNLRSWYKALSLFPGYAINARSMETMMGVEERFDLEDQENQSKWAGYLGIGRMIYRMGSALIRLPRQTRIFQGQLAEILGAYQKKDLSGMRVEEILDEYRRFEKELLGKWKPPMVNDFFAMIFFGSLQKMTTKLAITDFPNLHNDLLCGSSDIVSTEPITRLVEISTLIQHEPKLLAAFQQKSSDELWDTFLRGDFSELSTPIQEYLDRFGDRCIGELKLESIPYQEQPTALIRMIKAFVLQGLTSETTQQGISEKLRKNAEKQVQIALRNAPLKRLLFKWVLTKTRALVSNRENLRFARTQAFGMVRKLYRAMGQKLWSDHLLNDKEDIFYLKQEEIVDFVEGRAVDTNLKTLVEMRRKQYAIWETEETAARIRTYGMVPHGNSFTEAGSAIVEEGDLSGIGCCPGAVTGKVSVVTDPSQLEDLNGDILVCRTTDPGWVPLFPTASAILVERGSLLSHAAIVAREMGKPCIVGIKGLLQRLQTGDVIEMDGSSGMVRIMNEEQGMQNTEGKETTLAPSSPHLASGSKETTS